MKKVISEELSEYIEGLFFRYRSLDMVLRTIAIPSQYIKIDEEVRTHYLNEFNKAYTEWQIAMKELKEMLFPNTDSNKVVQLDFHTHTAELVENVQESCGCGK